MEDGSPLPSRAPSVGATAVLLQWTVLRAQGVLARALADTYPTRDAWMAAQRDPALLESIESLGQLLDELRELSALLTAPTLTELADFGRQHYDRALEAVEALATRLGIDPEDLLTVSIHG